jgi:hypothetical protein
VTVYLLFRFAETLKLFLISDQVILNQIFEFLSVGNKYSLAGLDSQKYLWQKPGDLFSAIIFPNPNLKHKIWIFLIPIGLMVAIKIPRNPIQNHSNFSNSWLASPILNRIAPEDPYHEYSNVPNSPLATLDPDNIAPEIETDPINIRYDEIPDKIFIENPPRRETDIADASDPRPTPQDPPDSVQKPNADNKRLGNHESKLIVFATFLLLILLDMATNCAISYGNYGGMYDILVFRILWCVGIALAL